MLKYFYCAQQLRMITEPNTKNDNSIILISDSSQIEDLQLIFFTNSNAEAAFATKKELIIPSSLTKIPT